MKKLIMIVLLLAATTACTEVEKPTVAMADPQFSYMQEVTVQRGFLKGQTGKIVSYKNCGDDYKPVICYSIKLNPLPGTDQSDTWENVDEKDLMQ